MWVEDKIEVPKPVSVRPFSYTRQVVSSPPLAALSVHDALLAATATPRAPRFAYYARPDLDQTSIGIRGYQRISEDQFLFQPVGEEGWGILKFCFQTFTLPCWALRGCCRYVFEELLLEFSRKTSLMRQACMLFSAKDLFFFLSFVFLLLLSAIWTLWYNSVHLLHDLAFGFGRHFDCPKWIIHFLLHCFWIGPQFIPQLVQWTLSFSSWIFVETWKQLERFFSFQVSWSYYFVVCCYESYANRQQGTTENYRISVLVLWVTNQNLIGPP